MICAAARGFLTQADCGAPAATACSHCGRPMCTAHLSPASGFSMCYDCAATQQPQQQQGEAKTEYAETYDDTWAHGYRASYYSSTGYRPYGSSSYDSSDARAFDERGGESFEDEERGAGFDAS
jgi:hypothetical protein